jgi:hypothetical protein
MYVFNFLGITNRNVLFSESEMIHWGFKIPEIVYEISGMVISVEVKRIVRNERIVPKNDSKFIRRRNNGDLWHWKSTISSGLEKVHDDLQEQIFQITKKKIQRHFLFILLPKSMTKKAKNNVIKRTSLIYKNEYKGSFNKKNIRIFFLEANDNLFTDLK